MIVVYDNIDVERGTARVIYEKGGTWRWCGRCNGYGGKPTPSGFLSRQRPKGNLILTTIFPRYAELNHVTS